MKNNNNHKNLSLVQENLKDFLTFYHELKVPYNKFFHNSNKSNSRLLVVSSPSRNGNHALLSLLDSHPSLPRTPGEDSFLCSSFQLANYDIHQFIKNIKGEDCVEFIESLSEKTHLSKWKETHNSFVNNTKHDIHSGIQSKDEKNFIPDYEKTLIDVNYNKYHDFLLKNQNKIKELKKLRNIFEIYLESLSLLDNDKKKTNYSGYIVGSGMRTELKWIFDNFPNTRTICSIRNFDTYAITHIKSRYRVDDYTNKELLKEAWEYWLHKTIDYIYLKLKYPDNIFLVEYKDISENTDFLIKNICKYLDIEPHKNMKVATVFGTPVKGNSSVSKSEKKRGSFYLSNKKIDKELLPKDFMHIWQQLEKLFYDKYKDSNI
jgi:hypothetical protein